jgi:hypothetical protein
LLIFFTDKGEHIMGLGRFLRKTVKAVGKNFGSAGKAVGKNFGSVGKAFGIKGRGVSRSAPLERIIATTSEVGKGVAQAQDLTDVDQRMAAAQGAISAKSFNKGGLVSSGRGDGAAIRGKTKCKMY